MTTIQYRIFAWFYMLVESAIAGGATAFAVAIGDVFQGTAQDLKHYLWNALMAAVVSAVFYLKKSPLPNLIQIKQEENTNAQ